MGAQTQNPRLAGSAANTLRTAQASRQADMERMRLQAEQERQAALQQEKARKAAPQTGKASMFPGEAPAPGVTPLPPGMEEAVFRRGEITRERDRTGRREEIFRDFQRAEANAATTPGGAVERGATAFGAAFGGAGQGPAQPLRSGIQFGPGRTTRMPDVNTPEYQQLINRVRNLGGR